MAKFTCSIPLNIEWNGLEFLGTSATTYRLPDALYEEFVSEVVPNIKGTVTWLVSDEIANAGSGADLTAHLADTSDAHDASAISFTPTASISATDLQAALAEVASESGGDGGVAAHEADTTSIHGIANTKRLLDVYHVAAYGTYVGDGVTDDTATIQAAIATTGVRGGQIYIPPSTPKVSGTLTLGRNQRLVGGGWEGTQLKPTAMSVPVIVMSGTAPAEGSVVRDIGIYGGGTSSIPAIRADAYFPVIDHVRIEEWDGVGISSTAPDGVHVRIRDVRVVNVAGTGVILAPTIGVYDNIVSSNGGDDGFWLRAAPTIGGNGVLSGCSADVNAGHGYYVTGGKWVFDACYGEANTGDVLHVDGTQDFASVVTLSASAAVGATTLSISALAKQLPERTRLRFGDGNWTYNQNLVSAGTTSLTIITPLMSALASGASATISADDLNPAFLPTVIVKGGYLDGSIYLNACHYSFEGCYLPVGGNGITATASARQIGDMTDIWTAKQRPRIWGGGGGSPSMQALLGETRPTPTSGLAFVADPLSQYELANANGTRISDSTALAGFAIRFGSQHQYATTSEGWLTSALPVGQYLIRAHVKNASQEASAIQIRANIFQDGGREVNKTFTVATTGWEWIEMDYDHTAARKSPGGQIGVQRVGASSNVEVDALVIIPKPQVVAAAGFIKSAAVATANRPSAVSVGAGGSVYDTTLGKQIWSNGTVWKDAAGTTV